MSFKILLAVVIGFCIGIGIESVSDQSQYLAVWILGLGLVVGLLWRRAGASACPAPHLVLLSILFFTVALGLFRTQLYEEQFDNSLQLYLDTEFTFQGEVIKDPDQRSRVQMLYVEYKGETILVSTDSNVLVSYGDLIEVSGDLQQPEAFTTDLGRTFNYVGYLQAKRIEYRVSFAEVKVVESGGGNILVRSLLETKHAFMSQLDQVLGEPQGSLADGLLLGLNQGLGDTLEEDFRRSGIVHIVVLSGYNIMLVVTFVMFLLSFFLRQRLRLIFGLLAIISFALIVGLSATVVRASIMASILLFAQTFKKSYDVLRALLVAGLAMLVINPYLLLFDIGFQLSFMATLGLIAALPWLQAGEQPEVLTSARGYVVATVATQIAVLPLLIYHIGEVSVVSVLVNVLVLPAVPFAMLGSFLAALLHALWQPVGMVVGVFAQGLLSYIIFIAEQFSALPFATIRFTEISAWWVLLLYAALFYIYWRVMFRVSKPVSEFDSWEIVEESDIKKVGADVPSAPTKDSVPKMFR